MKCRNVIWGFIIFICGNMTVLSQSPIEKSGDTILAANSINNILYIGIDNIIELNHVGPADQLIMTTDNGRIYKEENAFVSIPKTKGASKLQLYRATEQDTVLIKEEKFPTLYLQEPIVTLDTVKTRGMKEVSKQFMLQCDSVGIYITDDIVDIDSWYTVTGFTFGYVYGSHFISTYNRGKQINDKVKGYIKNMPPGHELTIRVELITEWELSIKGPVFRATIY
jgi:hypothetical protein